MLAVPAVASAERRGRTYEPRRAFGRFGMSWDIKIGDIKIGHIEAGDSS